MKIKMFFEFFDIHRWLPTVRYKFDWLCPQSATTVWPTEFSLIQSGCQENGTYAENSFLQFKSQGPLKKSNNKKADM